MNISIKELRNQKLSLDRHVSQIKEEVESLVKYGRKRYNMQEMEETYDNIAQFIGRVQNQQKTTVLTLRKLEALMEIER